MIEGRPTEGAVRLLCASHESAALDIAVSHALLLRVASGDTPSTTRLYRPRPTLAFGRLDVRREGFDRAVQAARRHGFEPIVRLAGGEAAAYHPSTLIFEQIVAGPGALSGTRERFAATASLLCEALTALGVAARVGELPGEYCPGAYSIGVAGTKVVGTAQRVVRDAALTSSVIVVGGGAPVRAVLVDVCAALARDWDPSTAGALDDHDAALGVSEVERALIEACREHGALDEGSLDDDTLRLARRLEPQHRCPPAAG